jgi:RHS repeat-associated protein
LRRKSRTGHDQEPKVESREPFLARHDFLPFGDELAPQVPPRDRRLFTGQERDFETGLDYFHSRRLRVDLGRFTTPDPLTNLAWTDGMLGAANPYSYVVNNPLGYIDPMGTQSQPGGGGDGTMVVTTCTDFGCSWKETVNVIALIYASPLGSTLSTREAEMVERPTEIQTAEGGGGTQANSANNGLKQKICRAIPSGRTIGASGGVGGVGSPGAGGELVVNYNSGQVSAFAFGGMQVGWNGGASGSVYSGFIYGLNSSNSNYSGGFTGVNGAAGIGGFAASSSGGLTGGPGGLVPNGAVKVGGVSFGGGLLGGFSGGVTATNYTNPAQLGKYWALGPVDWLLYAARQVCQ